MIIQNFLYLAPAGYFFAQKTQSKPRLAHAKKMAILPMTQIRFAHTLITGTKKPAQRQVHIYIIRGLERVDNLKNLVGLERLELSHLSAPEPKSGASTNSATAPKFVGGYYTHFTADGKRFFSKRVWVTLPYINLSE